MHAQLLALIGGLLGLGGCVSAAQREAAQEAQAEKEVAREIDRICSLPKEERDAQLEKLKKETGLTLYCGSAETEK